MPTDHGGKRRSFGGLCFGAAACACIDISCTWPGLLHLLSQLIPQFAFPFSLQLWLRLLLTHSRWHYIHRFCSLSKGLPNWQGPFHPKSIFTGISIFYVLRFGWLVPCSLLLVRFFVEKLVRKEITSQIKSNSIQVMIDWGPAMERGRAGSADSRFIAEVSMGDGSSFFPFIWHPSFSLAIQIFFRARPI
jgi:hypothetical protein